MMELLFNEDTTTDELNELADRAFILIKSGEAEMTAAKYEQVTRLLLSNNPTHLRHGIAKVMAAHRYTLSDKVWAELKELGFNFKSRKVVCDGLKSPVAGERQEAYSLYLDMRLEASERAEEVGKMLAAIDLFVGDTYFWQNGNVRNPLRSRAERANELNFDDLVWTHRILKGIYDRFFDGSGRKAKPAKEAVATSTVSFEEWRAAKAK